MNKLIILFLIIFNYILLSSAQLSTSGYLYYNASCHNITSSLTTPLVGVTNGLSATSGYVGQTLMTTVLSTDPYVLPGTSTFYNAMSLTIPPGDWDIYGNCHFIANDNIMYLAECGFSTTSATPPDNAFINEMQITATVDTYFQIYGGVVPPIFLNVNTPTTVYLTVASLYVTGTVSISGYIAARRMR